MIIFQTMQWYCSQLINLLNMAEPKKEKDNQQHAPPRDHVQRRYSTTTGVEESRAQQGSTARRVSLTQGLKESGQKVVQAVGTLFKDNRWIKKASFHAISLHCMTTTWSISSYSCLLPVSCKIWLFKEMNLLVGIPTFNNVMQILCVRMDEARPPGGSPYWKKSCVWEIERRPLS